MHQSFEEITAEMIAHPRFEQLKTLVHHGERNSVYEHSIRVARLAYRMATALGWDEDTIASVTRAALLHDFFGYDWHSERFRNYVHRARGLERLRRMHAFVHGHMAAERARRYFGLNPTECEAIRCHMFPVVMRLPRSRTAWAVTMADKVVAMGEMCVAIVDYAALWKQKTRIFKTSV